MIWPKAEIRLDVLDAERSVAFYAALLGVAPASRSASLSIFEFDAPPLVLALETRRSARGARTKNTKSGVARRFALVVPEPEYVGKAAVALWRAGARLRLLDEGIEASDPDGNAWRVRLVPSAKGRSITPID
jgi:hypothetical protein